MEVSITFIIVIGVIVLILVIRKGVMDDVRIEEVRPESAQLASELADDVYDVLLDVIVNGVTTYKATVNLTLNDDGNVLGTIILRELDEVTILTATKFPLAVGMSVENVHMATLRAVEWAISEIT